MTTIPERRNASSDNIPDYIWEEARRLRNVVNWTSNASVEAIAMFLLAAEKRGREEAAKIADKHSAENWGHTEEESAAIAIASAIRSTN